MRTLRFTVYEETGEFYKRICFIWEKNYAVPVVILVDTVIRDRYDLGGFPYSVSVYHDHDHKLVLIQVAGVKNVTEK